MQKNRTIKYLFPFFLLIPLILQILVLSCANMIPPTGGPKDTLAPVLLSVRPADSSVGFNERTITFEFDEYVSVDNIQQNLLVSPVPSRMPDVQARLRTVTVRLRDTLEPNTTYYINFGNAIRDVNESNPFHEFSYIFSTGSSIDTFQFSGNVVLAETGKIDTTLIAMLHRSADDSAVINDRPRYIARLDGKGYFHFRYLSPGTYYLYAVKDDSRTGRYFGKTQLFAFADSPVEIGANPEPVTLYAFSETKPAPPSGLGLPATGGRDGGTGRADDRRLRFSTNLISNQLDLLDDLVFTFEHPLRNFDSTKIQLSMDTAFNAVTNIKWELDTSGKKLNLETPWRENTVYNIIMDRDFAEDTLGRKLLKTDTLHFKTRSLSEYGKVRVRVRNLDLARKPVLQFVQGDKIMNSYPLTSELFTTEIFFPGEYELRILYDTNGNGKWDPGDFFNGRKQPEIVRPIGQRITVRPNWENEFEF